ncbi:Myc-type basic helix-loop-helix (bHLH) domain [Arabidopsis suecica]|uniref:Myc-type basic helix-loop-helix (BHLH) domain n=1 Tax=Arabidopsis suecica TaxID=45249 RepID=A0A8T2H3A3_ARASU|nr:Myc-type basic helix-loop-helix (bHLH) domain [Arabidopsis suecica]
MVVGEWFSFGWKDRPVGLGQGSILPRRSFALSLLWPPGNLPADLLRRPRPPVYQGALKWRLKNPYSSLFIPDFAYENDLDFSSLITPSTHISFQEPYPCNPVIHCAGIENDGRQKACETTMTSEIRKGDDEPKNKRAKHKELERQRRQEITSLFKNLRYLLPSQYTKGKRSASDHVLEAVNYIKDLQKKIKDVSEKRDRIKRSITHRPSSTGECSIRSSTCSCVGDTHIAVVVRPCLIGLEIVVSCCYRNESCLSSVLQLLAQEQCFNVVSCISTRLYQRIVHTIVSEVIVHNLFSMIYEEIKEGVNLYFMW